MEAKGIPVILDTLMRPAEDRVVEQAVLAMQHFVFDPMTRKVCPVRIVSRSISPRWRSNRLRLAPRTYAPWGCVVRVVSQTKS